MKKILQDMLFAVEYIRNGETLLHVELIKFELSVSRTGMRLSPRINYRVKRSVTRVVSLGRRSWAGLLRDELLLLQNEGSCHSGTSYAGN